MLLVIIQILNVLAGNAAATPATYDQRQTGNSNVRIDVRDAVLLAISDDFDYDFSYDYTQLTIKPEESSTSEISTTSTTTTTTMHSNSSVVIDNSMLTLVPGKPSNESKVTLVQPSSDELHIPVVVVQDAVKLVPQRVVERKKAEGHRRCIAGFVLDEQNRCKRIRGYQKRGHQEMAQRDGSPRSRDPTSEVR